MENKKEDREWEFEEWSKLKGTGGFCITWIMLLICSIIITYYDLKIGIMGFIITILFGFLGFDMLKSLCKRSKGGP